MPPILLNESMVRASVDNGKRGRSGMLKSRLLASAYWEPNSCKHNSWQYLDPGC